MIIMFSVKDVTVCDNKKIHIFDNLFSFEERYKFHDFITSSYFRINGSDDSSNLYRNQIYSSFNSQDMENMTFYETKGFQTVDSLFSLSSRKIHQIRVNCCLPTESSEVHKDFSLTLLYYVNLKWQINHGGHTIFLNESLSDIEYTSAYVPGRLIIFDGSIPHMIILPNNQANAARLSLVIQYK